MRDDPAREAWKARARAISTLEAARELGFKPAVNGNTTEKVGPCPACCGGEDRFSIRIARGKVGVFYCRFCGISGNDGIGLVMAVRRVDFPTACEILVGPPPDGGRLSEADKQTFVDEQARLAADRAAQDERDRVEALEAEARARSRAIELWSRRGEWRGSAVERYLRHRRIIPGNIQNIGFLEPLPYWCDGEVIYQGMGMLARIEGPAGDMIGVQPTWIDPAVLTGTATGKGRPELFHPKSGKKLATKKVIGAQVGGTVRLIDGPNPRRLVGGEGSETVLGAHTGLTIQGSHLLPRCAFWSSVNLHNLRYMPVPDTVEEMILLGDGDSDPAWTNKKLTEAADMLVRPRLTIRLAIAEPGKDFASMLGDA